MDAAKYFKEKARLTGTCSLDCCKCKLDMRNNGVGEYCSGLELNFPEQAVSIMEQWSKDCPAETYRSRFLKEYPNADVMDLCIESIWGGGHICDRHCPRHWDSPIEEETK